MWFLNLYREKNPVDWVYKALPVFTAEGQAYHKDSSVLSGIFDYISLHFSWRDLGCGLIFIIHRSIWLRMIVRVRAAQSAWAEEYTDSISAEG